MDIDRRKLLKGSAAIPVVLTIRPAGATAKTSIGVCGDKDYQKPKPYKVLAGSEYDDEWCRKKISVCKLARWNSSKNKWETQEWSSGDPKKYFRCFDGSKYYELDRYSPYSTPAVLSSLSPGSGIQETKLEDRWALSYLGSDGQCCGYAWEPRGGKHCTRSCWTSMNLQYKT